MSLPLRRPLVVALLTVALLVHSSTELFACSLIDLKRAEAHALSTSGMYWIISGILGGAVVCLDVFQKRLSIEAVLAAALIIFHPRWTVRPSLFWTDCTFENVLDSQIVLAVICLLLGVRTFRFLRARKGRA